MKGGAMARDDQKRTIAHQFLATVCTLRYRRISEIDTYLSDVEKVNAFFV